MIRRWPRREQTCGATRWEYADSSRASRIRIPVSLPRWGKRCTTSVFSRPFFTHTSTTRSTWSVSRFSHLSHTSCLSRSLYSPSPECPARKSGDEWQGDPPKLQRRRVRGYGEFCIRIGMPRAGARGASLLRDMFSLVRLFHARPSSSSPPTHPPPIFFLACVARKSVASFSEYRPFSVLSVG